MSKDQGCFRTHNNIAPKGRGKGGRSIARMLAKMVWECDIFSTVLSKIVVSVADSQNIESRVTSPAATQVTNEQDEANP